MTTQQENQVTLYIATHNKTGLKYFGKTTVYFTEELLQEKYHGSGKYWVRHLKKHGDDVTMEIYGIYALDEVKEVALKFSEENNIVKSHKWSNLKLENGLDGGSTIWSEKSKIKNSISHLGVKNSMYGKTHSLETKLLLGKQSSLRTQGSDNPNAKKWKVTNPNGIIFIVEGGIIDFSKKHNLPTTTLATMAKENRIMKSGKLVGWKCEFLT